MVNAAHRHFIPRNEPRYPVLNRGLVGCTAGHDVLEKTLMGMGVFVDVPETSSRSSNFVNLDAQDFDPS